ncbi:zinc finger, CCHC-type containing protein [Tanacetum coccineum]|uniref:Zinc finger, CCHC-type containing protein n=1 Tax=Tanacetum coccineum TaxID=301880 RepID=A0ABQ4ZPA2_9ASTR
MTLYIMFLLDLILLLLVLKLLMKDVRKFLMALHPKWRAKVIAIKESKDLTTLSLDELINNLKVHEMIINKDSKIVKGIGEKMRSLTLKAKKNLMMERVRHVKTKNMPWRLDTSKSSSKEEIDSHQETRTKWLYRGSWSDSGEEDEEKNKDETCLMAQASNEKKMHFLLSSMSVVYVLTTPILEDGGDDATVEQIRKRTKWDNDDYVCRGLILNGMSDSLFDIYQNVESSKEIWDSLEAKYMAKDASSTKFIVSNFINYKMTDSRLVLEQYNELLEDFNAHLNIQEELYLIELGNHLRIKESLRVQDSDKPKGNKVASPLVVNMVEHNNSSRDCKGVNVGNKANGSGTKGSVDDSSNSLKGHNMFNKSLQVYYVTYLSKAYFVKDDDVAWIPNGTEHIGGSVVPKEFTEEVVQQPEPELRKSKRNRTPKNFRPEFQLYLIEGTRDEVFDQQSYCFNVEDDPKTFDEAMKS